MLYNSRRIQLLVLIIIPLLFFMIASCENNTSKQTQAFATGSVVSTIDNVEQFNKIFATSEERLLILDFYANWCPSCKELAPILERIAKENSVNVSVYKINIDKNSELAYSFGVRGIPHVIFLKNKENVLSLTGLYPKNMYLKAVERFSAPTEP